MAFVCLKRTYQYFKEYVESINSILHFEVHLYEDNETYVVPAQIHKLIFVSVFPYIIFSSQTQPIPIFLLNTEQLSRTDYIQKFIGMYLWYSNHYKQYILGTPAIIDYSIDNCKILEKYPIKTIFLPYFPHID